MPGELPVKAGKFPRQTGRYANLVPQHEEWAGDLQRGSSCEPHVVALSGGKGLAGYAWVPNGCHDSNTLLADTSQQSCSKCPLVGRYGPYHLSRLRGMRIHRGWLPELVGLSFLMSRAFPSHPPSLLVYIVYLREAQLQDHHAVFILSFTPQERLKGHTLALPG